MSDPVELNNECSDEWCKNKGTYTLGARCGNCGTKVLIRLTKGHERPGYHQGPECECCGCRVWSFA